MRVLSLLALMLLVGCSAGATDRYCLASEGRIIPTGMVFSDGCNQCYCEAAGNSGAATVASARPSALLPRARANLLAADQMPGLRTHQPPTRAARESTARRRASVAASSPASSTPAAIHLPAIAFIHSPAAAPLTNPICPPPSRSLTSVSVDATASRTPDRVPRFLIATKVRASEARGCDERRSR